MPDVTPDAATLRAAFYEARKQRAQLREARGALGDTVHLILEAEGDPALDVVMLRFPDSPYEGPPGHPRYRTIADLRAHLLSLVTHPPIPTPAEGGPPGPRRWRAMVFAHAVPGSGAELIVEVCADGADPMVPRWTWARQPLDGIAQALPADLDDTQFRAAFGVPLTLAGVWSQVLSSARAGRAEAVEIERGYLLFAHARDDAAAAAALRERAVGTARVMRLGVPDDGGLAQLTPGVAQWAPEHAEAIVSGALAAGAVVDRAIAREHLIAGLGTLGVDVQEHRSSGALVARRGESRWPLDLDLLLGAAVHLGRLFTETAVSFATLVVKNLDRIDRWLAAARAARPQAKWVVTGTDVHVTRADGSWGAKLDLTRVAGAAPPGTPAFEAELRFAADSPPDEMDTTRRCACGAPARLEARLVVARSMDEVRARMNGGRVPFLAAWPPEAPRAVVSVAVRCALHTRWATDVELARWAGGGPALLARLAEDLRARVFEAIVSARVGSGGEGKVILAQGEGVASAVLSDGLLVALNRSCGTPLAPGRCAAIAVPPDALCVFERSVDPALVSGIVARISTSEGDAPRPPSLRWDVDLSVAPVGAWSLTFPTEGAPPPSIRPTAPTIAS